MAPKILFVSEFPDAEGPAKALTPDGFDFVLAPEDSAEYRDALGEAEYLIGFVDRLVDDALFEAAPRLKLIQLLSAGYNRADLDAARRARVPIANNGGANAVAATPIRWWRRQYGGGGANTVAVARFLRLKGQLRATQCHDCGMTKVRPSPNYGELYIHGSHFGSR